MAHFFEQIEQALNQPNLIFNDWQTVLRIVFSGVFIYFTLILIMNLFGKRSIANLSMHDYVVTLAMGSIVASTIISKDATILDGLVGVIVLLTLQYLVTLTSIHYARFFKTINSSPVVLFLEGEFIEENLSKNRITHFEVYSAIRMQGQTTSDNIFAVVLESNGNLSIIKSTSEEKRDEITQYI